MNGTIIEGAVLGLPIFASLIDHLAAATEFVVGVTLIWAAVGAFIGSIIFSEVGLRNIARKKGPLAGAFVLGSLNLFMIYNATWAKGCLASFLIFILSASEMT